MVGILVVACITADACHGLPPALPSAPEWATPRWIRDAAGIVAGETVPDCAECDAWIACTVVEDVTIRGYHPWRLRPAEEDRPGRWNGWREPGERHYEAAQAALEGKCAGIPVCAFLGSLRDYTGHWRYGLAKERPSYIIGNAHGAIVCITSNDN